MNLQFFSDNQKTQAFERFAVDNNIKSIKYCRFIIAPIIYTQSDDESSISISTEDLTNTYKKYAIHDYAYKKYGHKIHKYIDHPQGLTYDEVMSSPPDECKDLSVSDILYRLNTDIKNTIYSNLSENNITEPTVETEPIAEPITEPITELETETEPIAEPIAEPTVETELFPEIESDLSSSNGDC